MPAKKIFISLFLFSGSMLASADQAELIVYSEHQPLVAQSLLLDVLQIDGGEYLAVGERGHIVKSNDGRNWVQVEVVPTRSTLTVVTEADGQLWAAGHDTVILHSGDKGNTWTRHYFDPERGQPVMDLHFTASGRGFAIGAYGLMLVSDDGGESWEELEVSEEGWHLNAMLDLGDGRLMIAGEAGYSYRSFDDGETWETLEMPYPGSMFGIVARTDGCIVEFGLRGNVQQSCDFGDSWTEPDSGTASTITAAVADGDGLLLVGNSGIVLHQDPAGVFSDSIHSSGVDFAAVTALGSGFILVGEEGVHSYPEVAGGDSD